MTSTTSEPGKALATFDPTSSAYPVLFDQEGTGGIAQVLEDNFGDEGFSTTDLDRITVPAGGGTAWEIPDEDPTRRIEGVIIHKQPTRAFWFKKRGEDGEEDGPPACYSDDAKIGKGVFGKGSEVNETGECATCPMNVFGTSTSGAGTGKACKEQMQVFLLQEQAILPLQISLPPTSLKGFKKYMTRLASKGRSFMNVVTEFTLAVEKGGGQTYSVVQPAKVRDLDPIEGGAARAYGNSIRDALVSANAARMATEAQLDPETRARLESEWETARTAESTPQEPAGSK